MSAEIYASRETHSRWIVYREHRSSNGSSNIQARIQESSSSRTSDDDDMLVFMEYLEPHLRPVLPEEGNPQSMLLYKEHSKLAQDYLKVQSELVMIGREMQDFQDLERLEDEENEKELQKLQQEKESLLVARQMLQEENQMGRNPGSGNSRDPEGWVVINNTQPS
ncbi:unnamed protein product [Brassicogethes aeneus]|uniref:Mitogen-activated protein kinase kinase kinase n=1 Tax=Brassicogethes aeneus TaxID=1431903 RepID=A0A9P0FQF1_BRAAE|nr:unnamed protein product [Brassicogethes aeneus]